MVGDNRTCIECGNGCWYPYKLEFWQCIGRVHEILHKLYGANCLPENKGSDYLRHAFREHIGRADAIAKIATTFYWLNPELAFEQTMLRQASKSGRRVPRGEHFVRAYFDGHKSGEAVAASWVLYRASSAQAPSSRPFEDVPENWTEVAHACIELPEQSTVLDAESLGLLGALSAVKNMLFFNLDAYLQTDSWMAPALSATYMKNL